MGGWSSRKFGLLSVFTFAGEFTMSDYTGTYQYIDYINITYSGAGVASFTTGENASYTGTVTDTSANTVDIGSSVTVAGAAVPGPGTATYLGEGTIDGNTYYFFSNGSASGGYAVGAVPLGGNGTYTVTGFNGGSSADLTLCFMAGTHIATPDGEVAVEALKAGDLVMTAAGAKPVRWMGESHVAARFADPVKSLPVRIAAGALGDNLPVRDLLVSPDHALFLEGMLVHASALVGMPGVIREHNMPAIFTYYHVELETHELLLAEGVAAESFVDNAGRHHFHNWDDRTAPATPIAEMDLPRVKSARQLPASLRTRAAA
jgi:hypothetical protein